MSDLGNKLKAIRERAEPGFLDGHRDSASPEVTLARLQNSQDDVLPLVKAMEAVLEAASSFADHANLEYHVHNNDELGSAYQGAYTDITDALEKHLGGDGG